MRRKEVNNTTLADRFFVGFLSGLTALVTAGLIWMLLAVEIFHIVLPSLFVWGSGIIGFLMGFFMLENYLLDFLGRVWHFLYGFVKHLFPY